MINFKLVKIISLNLIISFFSVEVLSYLFFKPQLQSKFKYYFNNKNQIGRGYPKDYFVKHKDRGFDISKNSKKIEVKLPLESKPYSIWGNKLGCYDDEIEKDKKISLYLAGDSQTWGYSPLEKKFGTILETKLKKTVAACGVTNTGQLHQFDKFIEITEILGYFPETVVVSVVINDIEDDFNYPNTTVYEGYLVGKASPIFRNENGEFIKGKERSEDWIKKRFNKLKEGKTFSGVLKEYDPRRFSAIAIIIGSFLKKTSLRDKIYSCDKNTYVKRFKFCEFYKSRYPIDHQVANNNKKIILEWIKHSKDNKYRLIFAMASNYFRPLNYSEDFCKLVIKNSSECYDFVNYVEDNGLNRYKLKWKNDGHFNHYGNKQYANFLLEILNNK